MAPALRRPRAVRKLRSELVPADVAGYPHPTFAGESRHARGLVAASARDRWSPQLIAINMPAIEKEENED